MIMGREELRRIVRAEVRRQPAADTFTRLDARSIFNMERHGIDALLTEPQLMHQARASGDPRLDANDVRERADAVFQALFLDRSPVSDAALCVLLSLRKLGMDVLGHKSLAPLRSQYARVPAECRFIDAMDMANLRAVSVRVDVFDDVTSPLSDVDDRIITSIAVDALADPQKAWPLLSQSGCKSLADVRQLIIHSAEKHCAHSLVAEKPSDAPLFVECALPVADALGIPVVYESDVDTSMLRTQALSERIASEGFAFAPYSSGARVIEALPGLWSLARRAIGTALEGAYISLMRAGWQLSSGEISHDIEQFLGKTKQKPEKKRELLFTDRMHIVHKQEV